MKAIARLGLLWGLLAMLCFFGCQSSEPLTVLSLPEMTLNVIRAQQQGLQWLEHMQNKDGSWGTGEDEIPAATGLALLAFLWHGDSGSTEKYWESVRRGLEFLIAEIQSTNGLACGGRRPAFGHAIAVKALCEGYDVTMNPSLKYACEKGLTEICQGQRDSGLWNVSGRAGEDNIDIVASVWQVMALKCGVLAGLETNGYQRCLGKAADAMEIILSAETDIDKRVGILLCLQICGRGRSAVCRRAVDDLATLTPDSESPSDGARFLRWYLAMHVFYNEGGRLWSRWLELHRPLLLKEQKRSRNVNGKEVGYWESSVEEQRFSRVCTTALAVMMLETYPPHYLPSFINLPAEKVIQPGFGDDIEVELNL